MTQYAPIFEREGRLFFFLNGRQNDMTVKRDHWLMESLIYNAYWTGEWFTIPDTRRFNHLLGTLDGEPIVVIGGPEYDEVMAEYNKENDNGS